MAKVTIPVLWDGSNQFLNGALVTVDSQSIVSGPVSKPAGQYVPPYIGEVGFVACLEIKDLNQRIFYTTLTLPQYQAIVSGDTQDPNKEKIYELTATSGQTTVTNAALYNIQVIQVEVNGVILDPATITYSTNPIANPPTGTVGFGKALTTGDKAVIQYYSI